MTLKEHQAYQKFLESMETYELAFSSSEVRSALSKKCSDPDYYESFKEFRDALTQVLKNTKRKKECK